MEKGQQMRFTQEEISLIKSTYGNNDELLKLLRKVFLPELNPELPLGQMIDLWMTIPVDQMTPEQALINLKARNTVIGHIEAQLMQLKILANEKDLTPEEVAKKIIKDSGK